jgi:hypothetical protein
VNDYTPEQLRKLDVLIARHIFRLTVLDMPQWMPDTFAGIELQSGRWEAFVTVEPTGLQDEVCPDYTTDWRHAGRVLEWLVGVKAYTGGVTLRHRPSRNEWQSGILVGRLSPAPGVANTLPLAICLHALRVVGVDVEREVAG